MSLLNLLASSVQDTLTFYKRRRQFDELFKYIRKKAPNENAIRNVRELNALLDLIIDDFAEQLRQKKLENQPIREVRQTFSRTWMGFTFGGTFCATNGKIENLSTVYRRDNCVLAIPRPNDRIFSFNLSLKKAAVDFEQYELHCGLVNTKGRLYIEARENLISVRVTMELKKSDKVHKMEVTRAEVTKCGKFKIRVSGFGPLGGNSLAKLIIKLMLNKQINEMKADFERELRIFITRTIESFTV